MSVSNCVAACQGAGYSLAGVEYSGECYCDNTISNGGTLAPEGVSGCSMLCNGNFSEYCGGPSRLDVYDFNKTVTLPPWNTTSLSSTSSVVSSSSTRVIITTTSQSSSTLVSTVVSTTSSKSSTLSTSTSTFLQTSLLLFPGSQELGFPQIYLVLNHISLQGSH